LVDECVLRSWWLAKFTAAFFKMSSSSVVRLSSALTLFNSCLIASGSLASGDVVALFFLS